MFKITLTPHWKAVIQALFVTFLWSTSWVLIKIGLVDLPALTFAGLRYGLAFLCLLPWVLRTPYRTSLRGLSGRDWVLLFVLGALGYGFTQGAQYVGLFYLPTLSVSLMLNFTPVLVALMGILFLAERPSLLQWLGMALFMLGIMTYFYPVSFPGDQAFGMLVVTAGVAANAVFSVLGRSVNRREHLHPLVVTGVSMGIGASVLLSSGISIQGLPALKLQHWAIIVWLAVVNSAFAYTLWNHTMRTLSAVESSVINSTMTVQIAILAWVFLGEGLSLRQVAGMILATIGVLVVQLRGEQLGRIVARINGKMDRKYNRQDGSAAEKNTPL